MTIEELLKNKEIKGKDKTEQISQWILDHSLPIEELLAFAEKQKDPAKATCIEAMEFATSKNPEIADENMLRFVTKTLESKAPRVKWESARVIGNIAAKFPTQLDQTVQNLFANTRHEGTVVRWSAATALGEIIKLKTTMHANILQEVNLILEKEEKASIKKIYLSALKKSK